MTTRELTELQMKLLRTVEEAGGEEHTETLYDMVEAERPTLTPTGRTKKGKDPYETSREEVGGLEREGFLTWSDDTSAAGGKSVLTEKGRRALACRGCRVLGMNPSHDGSRRCKSGSLASGGSRAHCTCDTCF
jgi:hypothetical protein